MIKRVVIKNFKVIKDADLDLTNLTIFTAINGMGKSSIIQALLLLRQSQLDKKLPKQLLLNNNKYVSLGRSEDVFNYYSEEGEGLEIILDTTTADSIAVNTKDRKRRTWLDIDFSEPKEWSKVESEPLFSEDKRFQYLHAERINPKTSYDTNEYDVVELRSLGSTGEYTAHFIARHKDEQVALPSLINPSNSKNLLAQLDTWLSKISKGIHIVSNLDESARSARLSFQFEVGNDLTPEFSPVNVGFGLTYVLPVLVAVLSSKPGDLVIIENPESHLHPSGQSAIGEFLALAAQDGLQLIIETHSDHLLQGVRIAAREFNKNNNKGISPENVSIYYLSRDNEKHQSNINAIKVDANGKLYQTLHNGKKTATLPKGFTDEWATNSGKLI